MLFLRSNSVTLTKTATTLESHPSPQFHDWKQVRVCTLSILQQELPYSPARVRVHTCCGFIQNDNLGSTHKGQGHRQFPLHPAYKTQQCTASHGERDGGRGGERRLQASRWRHSIERTGYWDLETQRWDRRLGPPTQSWALGSFSGRGRKGRQRRTPGLT